MNLDEFDLKDLLLTALKSEIDSKNIYGALSKKIKNYLLKDKLEFLVKEEEKHRKFIEEIYLNHYPNEKIIIPDKTVAPLPEININSEDTPLSNILKSAMEAEKAANEFYNKLSSRFEDDTKIKTMLMYFADMEMGHYKLLEVEKESMERFEEADVYWPMVHAGP